MRAAKRFLAVILALVMSMSLAVMGFADPTQEELLAQYYAALAKQQATQNENVSTENIASATSDSKAIYNRIMALKATYPEGMPWDESNTYMLSRKSAEAKFFAENPNTPDWAREDGINWVMNNPMRACSAFAYTIQDTVFGRGTYEAVTRTALDPSQGTQLIAQYYPETKKYGCWEVVGYDGGTPEQRARFEHVYSQIKVGDQLCDGRHAVVVLEKNDKYVTVVEGNSGGKVRWGRKILKESLAKGLYSVITRY